MMKEYDLEFQKNYRIILRDHQGFLKDPVFREMLTSEASLCECRDNIEVLRCIEENPSEKKII
ncbi:MAG: hypothetical protein ACFFDK_03250, partial [Promethearchaeota archaeon]